MGNTSILLVAPDSDTAEMYAVGLRLAGYSPVIAQSADDAATRLRVSRPAAVVAEVEAAAHDDWRLIRGVRASAATSDLPVVVLAGRADDAIRRGTRELHCAALLLKPCLPDALARVIGRVLVRPAPQDLDWEQETLGPTTTVGANAERR